MQYHYLPVPDLLTLNQQLRKLTSEISVATTKVQTEAAQIRKQVEAVFADVQMPKQDKINAINRQVRQRVDALAKPVKEKVNAKLKEMEALRLRIEDGRQLMTNPISYLAASSLTNPKFHERRLAGQRFTEGAGPAELRTMLAVARSTNDVGLLSAVIAANDRLPTKSRTFTNAEAIKDVQLPGFQDVLAVYNDVTALPQFAIHCSRALDSGGDVKAADRIARGLAASKVETNPDGSLVGGAL